MLYSGIYYCKSGSMCICTPHSVIPKVVCFFFYMKDPCRCVMSCGQMYRMY